MKSRFVLFGIVTLCSAAATAQQYRVIDLGAFSLNGGAGLSGAEALNDNGQATGYSYINANDTHAFSYSGSTGLIDIGNIPSNPSGPSIGYGVNNNGEVVGRGTTSTGQYHAFIWSQAAGMVDIGPMSGGTQSIAWGINDSGQVAGYGETSTSPAQAFVWTRGGGFNVIGGITGTTLPSFAFTINNNGQVGGGSVIVANQYSHGFVYTPGSGFVEIGDFDGGHQDSAVRDLNNLGNAVGNATIPTGTGGRSSAAFYWSPSGGEVNLGGINPTAPNDTATGINDQNQVVGWGFAGTPGDLGWIWTQQQGMHSLNSLLTTADASFWDVTVAYAINNNGVIAAEAFHGAAGGGYTHAVLLTPVPEPSSLLAVAGLAGWFGARRKRRN